MTLYRQDRPINIQTTVQNSLRQLILALRTTWLMVVMLAAAAGWLSAAVFFALLPAFGAAGACALAGLFLLLVVVGVIFWINRPARETTETAATDPAAQPLNPAMGEAPRPGADAVLAALRDPQQSMTTARTWLGEHRKEALAVAFGIGVVAALDRRLQGQLVRTVGTVLTTVGPGLMSGAGVNPSASINRNGRPGVDQGVNPTVDQGIKRRH